MQKQKIGVTIILDLRFWSDDLVLKKRCHGEENQRFDVAISAKLKRISRDHFVVILLVMTSICCRVGVATPHCNDDKTVEQKI